MFLVYPKQKYFSLPPHLSILVNNFIILQPHWIPFQHFFSPFQPLYLSSHCPKIRCDNNWLFGSDGIINSPNNKAKKLFGLSKYIPFHVLHLFCFLNILLSLHFSALYAPNPPLCVFYLLHLAHFCLLIQPEHMPASLPVLLQIKYQSISQLTAGLWAY